jgi:DNA-binding NarL/FixJ family response regulator
LLSAIRAAQRDEPHPANALDIQPVSFNTPLAQDLTPAEALVLSLVAHGANNRTIARQLKLSEQTVANRLQVVYEKLGVNNRIQATLLALRHGWVSLDE